MRTVAVLAAALLASPALAQEAPQTTALTAPQPSVVAQIDDYLRTSPAVELGEGASGVTSRDDRKVRGEVAVGVGTGGYRSFYMRGEAPVGESGRVSVAIGDTRYGRGFGAGTAFGGPMLDRHRCGLEALTPPRPMDVRGPDGRCVGPPGP